jgi:hypothetical protein
MSTSFPAVVIFIQFLSFSFYELPSTHETRRGSGSRQDSARPQAKDQLQFKDENGGKGITKDGNLFSFHTYTSNDGVKLLTYIETCSSGLNAKRALDQKIKEASSIRARGPKLGKDGKPIGERVVLTVEKKAQGGAQSESFICWTAGSELHWIQSQSLKYALAFEKTLDP